MDNQERIKSDNNDVVMSRAKKNQALYEEINQAELENFDVNSNATVLSEASSTIDIDQLRNMLDKKYREDNKTKPLVKQEDLAHEEINLDETREYDINTILSKAKEEKEDNYEVERLKELKNTQLDILNSLNINSEETKVVSEEEGDKLQNLIDTINLTEATNAIKNKDIDPLDILSDLKGEEDDEKTSAQQKSEDGDSTLIDTTEEITKEISDEEVKELNKDDKKISKKVIEKEEKIDDSFYTTSNLVTQNDFEDFSDLKNDMYSTKFVIKVLIAIVVLAFILGVVFVLNKTLGWGLF